MGSSVVHLWPGDHVRLPSGSKGRLVRWHIQVNADLGANMQERVAELEMDTGAKFEASESLMRHAVKVA
jgi:hypothetical protein